MHLSLMVLSSLLLAAASPGTPPPSSVTLQGGCFVFVLRDGEAQVPAKEAGALVQLAVVEGQQVKAGDLLAQIDDVDAQLAAKAMGLKLDVAKEEAVSSSINVEFARAAADVSQADYEGGLEANRQMPGTYPKSEMRRLLLTWKRSQAEIKKAESDQKVAGLKAKVSGAEAEQAAEAVRRRQIRSPLDGEVVELRCHPGEWVKPGDPAAYVVRMDRLRIEGFVSATQVEPGEVDKRPVTITVQLARQRQENFSGEVVFASPVIQASNKFRIWVEVENRKENGHWLLHPGHSAEMIIHLK